jgi:16S rRNA (adenine1518-N6/adenine1519-N6)-dimethyltransferase
MSSPLNPLPKKSLGQHWLNDKSSLESICGHADIKADDIVLEIGPGLGSLTKLLAAKAKEVVAIELDNTLATLLANDSSHKNIRVISQDILKFNFSDLPPDYKIVANIPYYLTSKLLRVISETPNSPKLVVLLIQKEVAERVAASAGSMSLISVTAQYFWDVRLGEVIKSNLFTPPPKVDSQVIVLYRKVNTILKNEDPRALFRLVKAGFASRRKTLHNSLAGGLRISKEEALSILNAADIDPSARPQTLSIEQWHSLYKQALLQKII